MESIYKLLVATVFIFLVGCETTPRVDTDYREAYNFSALKTYAVQENTQKAGTDLLVSPFTLTHLHDVVSQQLGQRYAPSATPDFYVRYHVVFEEKIDPRSYDDIYGYGFYRRGYYRHPFSPFFYGPNAGVRTYNQGSLIIDIYDAKTNQPLWRGVSEKRLSRGMSPRDQRAVLAQAAVEVISAFPPVVQ